MTYATKDDIIDLYSLDALYVADRDGDGVVDDVAVDKAINSASDEIDAFLGVRYTVPLTTGHSLVTQFCVDIALYRLALARDVQTEEHRQRYEDAITRLKDIAHGRASLNVPGPVDPDTGEPKHNSPKPIVAGGPEREFTREKMRGL